MNKTAVSVNESCGLLKRKGAQIKRLKVLVVGSYNGSSGHAHSSSLQQHIVPGIEHTHFTGQKHL
jgi:hypothetical protein